VEPGSSIMPGKVNPSVPEAVQMACFQVSGNDLAIALASSAGELELNVMTPLVAANLADSFELLTRGVALLRQRCLDGLTVDRERVRGLMAGSLVEATALNPYLGYEVTAELVKEALASRRPLRDVLRAHGLLAPADVARLLAPAALTGPRATDMALSRRIRRTPAYAAFRATRLQ
jgi:aspartate ammonia-lyase